MGGWEALPLLFVESLLSVLLLEEVMVFVVVVEEGLICVPVSRFHIFTWRSLPPPVAMRDGREGCQDTVVASPLWAAIFKYGLTGKRMS